MNLKPRALAWLIKLLARSVERIAPKNSLSTILAPKLTTVSTKVGLPKIPNIWGLPKAFTPRRIPLGFSTYFGFSGLTRPITNFFFAAIPEFATNFSTTATPEIVPVAHPAEKSINKFDETESLTTRPGPGFSVARFFAASPENAGRVVLLADALHNLEAGPEKAKTTTNYSSRTIVDTEKANCIALRSGLTVEKVSAKWPRETPHYWRSISAQVIMPVKVTKPEWSKIIKSRSSSGSTGTVANPSSDQYLDLVSALDMDRRFTSRENPFKALEAIGDGDFQTPYCRKQQTRSIVVDLSPPSVAKTETRTETSTKINPIEVPVPVPTSTSTAATPILAPIPLTMISPPLTPTMVPENSTENTDQDSPRKSRRQRRRNTSTSPTPVLKKPPILMPSKDTPESWRQTSSPPRSPSPLNSQPKTTANEWQVQTRRRGNSRKHDMDASRVASLDFSLTPNLAPAEHNGSDIAETDTMVRLNTPNVVILYKKKHTVPV